VEPIQTSSSEAKARSWPAIVGKRRKGSWGLTPRPYLGRIRARRGETGVMASRFTSVVIDANDVALIGEFWGAVLGRDGEVDDEGDLVLKAPDSESVDVLVLGVPEGKRGKNRLHIDLNPTDADRDEELERLLALGARRVDIGQGEVSWVVLADPEGNEFCLLSRRVDGGGGAITPG
jgi:hypothetical protein